MRFIRENWGLILLFIGFSGFILYQQNLLNSECIIAKAKVLHLYDSKDTGVEIEFFHSMKRVRCKAINSSNCYRSREVGDTVLIKYSIRNPKIATTLACYYDEKKHGHLIGKKLNSAEIEKLLK